jgi:hypothetical protein
MAKGSTAVYLYCVVRAARRPALARVPPGLPGGARPDAHRLSGSLWLVTADVPLDVYGPAHLEPRLRDLDWVSDAALAHEAVVEHFSRAKGAVVVPTKLFTMFSSMDKAAADVAAGKTAIERAMRHIAGSEEWGVRITRRPGVPARASRRPARPSSGAAFLAARKEARDASAHVRAASLAAVEAAFERLSRHARDAQQRPRRQEAGSNPPILEAAFLVRAGARALQGGSEAAGRALCVRRRRADPHRAVARLQLCRNGGSRVRRSRTRPGPPKGAKPSTVTAPPGPSPARPRLPTWEAKPPPPKRGAPLPKLAFRAHKTVAPKRHVGRIIDDEEASLLDLIDNLLNKGVMLNADLILALADVDLIYIRLSALLCAADRVLPPRSTRRGTG